jgi:hypothetical protein
VRLFTISFDLITHHEKEPSPMKKHLLFLLLAMSMPMFAQTTYSLPTTTVDYIPYSSYANLFANDIPITIDGVPYYVNVTAHTDSVGKCVSSCYVTFQNLNTYEEIPVPYTGSFSAIAFGKPTTLSGTFSGAFNGSFVLSIVPFQACGRYGCHTNYRQQGSTVSLN